MHRVVETLLGTIMDEHIPQKRMRARDRCSIYDYRMEASNSK